MLKSRFTLALMLLAVATASVYFLLPKAASLPQPTARPIVALVPMGTTDEYWKAVHAGGIKAAKELNVELIWQGPIRRDDRSSQLDVVDSMVIRGVSGIVLAPIDNMALRSPVNDAYLSHIPVIVIDSDLASDKQESFIRTDNEAAGFLAGEHLASLLGYKGRVAILRGVEGNSSTDHREVGFIKAIRQHKDMQIVSDSQHGGGTTESAYKASENLIAPFKNADKLNLDGIFCPNESTTFGMLRALQDGGLAGKIKFVGFDFSPKLLAALRTGEISALVAQDPVTMGYLGVKAVVDKLQGKELTRVVDVKATIVTQKNIDEPAVKGIIEPDLSILETKR